MSERRESLKNVVLAHGLMSQQIQQAEQGEDQPLHVLAIRDRPAQLSGDASGSGDSQTGLGGNVAEIQFLSLQRDRGGNIETTDRRGLGVTSTTIFSHNYLLICFQLSADPF